MKPIGRVFLVLNLVLAGCFVAFAGTYLQRANHWKEMHDAVTKTAADDYKELEGRSNGYRDAAEEEKRQSGILKLSLSGAQTKLEEEKQANATLMARFATIEASINASQSSLAKIDSELATARAESKAAMDRAIAAESAKSDAVDAKNAAEKLLADANFKIKNQETAIQDSSIALAKTTQTIREKDVLLDLVNRRYPAIFETLHPLVTGSVSRVSEGGFLVINLKSGAENLKAGARFAIYDAAGYKGEATVREVDGSKGFCFAKLTLDEGKVIKAGDNASTNLSASRSN